MSIKAFDFHSIPPQTQADDDGIVISRSDMELGEWGIVLSIISALFTSTGLCLQKLVHRKIAADASQGPAFKHSLYFAGVAYVAIGLFLKAFIDVLLPQSAIAPLSAQTVVYSTLLEYLFLQGEMNRLTIASIIVTSGGMVLATWGANTTDGQYSLHDLWELFMTQESIIVSASLFAAIIGMREFLKSSMGSFASPAGLVYVSLSAGLFAGWFGTSVKSTLEVIKFAFIHGMQADDVRNYGVWLMIGSLALLGIPKLRIVSYALSEFHHIQFLPLYQVKCFCVL